METLILILLRILFTIIISPLYFFAKICGEKLGKILCIMVLCSIPICFALSIYGEFYAERGGQLIISDEEFNATIGLSYDEVEKILETHTTKPSFFYKNSNIMLFLSIVNIFIYLIMRAAISDLKIEKRAKKYGQQDVKYSWARDLWIGEIFNNKSQKSNCTDSYSDYSYSTYDDNDNDNHFDFDHNDNDDFDIEDYRSISESRRFERQGSGNWTSKEDWSTSDIDDNLSGWDPYEDNDDDL